MGNWVSYCANNTLSTLTVNNALSLPPFLLLRHGLWGQDQYILWDPWVSRPGGADRHVVHQSCGLVGARRSCLWDAGRWGRVVGFGVILTSVANTHFSLSVLFSVPSLWRPWGSFFKFGTNIQLDPQINWQSKFTVASQNDFQTQLIHEFQNSCSNYDEIAHKCLKHKVMKGSKRSKVNFTDIMFCIQR